MTPLCFLVEVALTVEDFVGMCERANMRQHIFTLNIANRFDNEIPCSELAMHVRVAGKTPQLIFLSENKRYAYVLTTDGQFVDGLTSEVVPWSARPADAHA